MPNHDQFSLYIFNDLHRCGSGRSLRLADVIHGKSKGLEPLVWQKTLLDTNELLFKPNIFLRKEGRTSREIFGLNLRLASRALGGVPVFPYLSALCAAESVGQKSESLILVQYS